MLVKSHYLRSIKICSYIAINVLTCIMIFHGTLLVLSEVQPTIIANMSTDELSNFVSLYAILSSFVFIYSLSKKSFEVT